MKHSASSLIYENGSVCPRVANPGNLVRRSETPDHRQERIAGAREGSGLSTFHFQLSAISKGGDTMSAFSRLQDTQVSPKTAGICIGVLAIVCTLVVMIIRNGAAGQAQPSPTAIDHALFRVKPAARQTAAPAPKQAAGRIGHRRCLPDNRRQERVQAGYGYAKRLRFGPRLIGFVSSSDIGGRVARIAGNWGKRFLARLWQTPGRRRLVKQPRVHWRCRHPAGQDGAYRKHVDRRDQIRLLG